MQLKINDLVQFDGWGWPFDGSRGEVIETIGTEVCRVQVDGDTVPLSRIPHVRKITEGTFTVLCIVSDIRTVEG